MAPNYSLTAEMFAAMMRVTRIESEKMTNALHDVLVLGHKISPTATRYDIKKQQLSLRAKHLTEVVKPAFDEYAALVHCAEQ